MLAPRFRLATLDRGLCDREPLPRDSHLSTRRRTFPPASNFQLRFLSRCTPSGRRPDLHPLEPTSPLQSALTQKRGCKSFGIHSYKIIGLKLSWNDILTKNTGGGRHSPLATFS